MPGSFASRRSSCEGREGERLQVCDFQLRIRDDFQEDAAGILIDGFLHRLDIRQVPQARLDAEGHQGSGDERKRVPEQMPGGDDVLALRGDGEDGVADSRHAGIVPHYVGRPRQGPDAVLEIGHRGVFHARVIGGFRLAGKRIGNLLGVLEPIRHVRIDGHRQRAIGVRAHKRRMEGYRLFFHFLTFALKTTASYE